VILDLDTIVIGGSLSAAADRLLQKLSENIRDNTIWPELQTVDLRWSQLGENQIAIGAATLILEKALDDLTWFPSKTELNLTSHEGHFSH
jgi:predicted NBD/HSP70 family sugar kinase